MSEKEQSIAIQHLKVCLGSRGDQSVHLGLDELKIEQGSLWALTGASGCGKSSLLKVIAGLISVDGGSVEVLGQKMSELSGSEADTFRGQHIGFIYQEHNLFEGFSALENVLLGLRFGRKHPTSEHRELAIDSLKRVNLEHRLNAKPASMSVGERQRVAVARALVNQPDILLADEATGALDPVNGKLVFEMIIELCKSQSCTLLFVTHDMDLAHKLPNRFDCSRLISDS